MRRGLFIGALALTATLWTAGEARAQSGYLDYDDFTRELRSVVDGSSNAQMRSIARSHEGRDIWLVEVGNRSGTPLAERPGVLVVGNLEGDHVVGSHMALEVIRYLLNDASAQGVLDEQVVYVVPRLNPDGAEAMFAGVRYDRRGNALSYDDDNDGRFDEDPGEDLNGDGMITVMRVPDPMGAFMVHPDDERLMKRADKAAGETGTHTLYIEGVDSDGDGFLNEDGPGGVDLNRNWQHTHPYYQADAGPHMVSEPETRALMDFMVANENIGAVLAFGHSDNLVNPPNSRGAFSGAAVPDLMAFAAESNADVLDVGVFGGGGGGGGFFFGGAVGARGAPLRGAQPGRDNDPQSGRRPAETVNNADLDYFEAVSEAYKEITGITEVVLNREPAGAFYEMAYYQRGIPAFSTQGWGATESMEGSGVEAKALAWADGADVDFFQEWSAHDHPDLGAVEIGGFHPYALTNPMYDSFEEPGRMQGEFVVRLAGMLPRVRIAETEVTAHGGGVFTVTAEVENTGYLPTSMQHGVVSRSVAPTIVQIGVEPEAIMTGDSKTSRIQKLDGSGSRAKFSWVIQGRSGQEVQIRVRSEHGGTDTTTVTLR